jgi:hypothetical protein
MATKITITLPDGRKADDKFMAWAEAMLSEAGVTQQQADFIVGKWQAHSDEWMRTDDLRVQAAADQAVAETKRRWGSDFDSHIASGKKAVAQLGLDAAALNALDKAIGGAAVVDLLARLGRNVVSDPGTGKTSIAITGPEEARAQIARLAGDKTFQDTLRDTRNPAARADALARWNDLHAAAYPTTPDPAAPNPVPSPAPAPAGAPSKRDAALARIDQLRGDHDFQQRMRNPGPGREDAVRQWNLLHQEAYAAPELGDTQ